MNVIGINRGNAGLSRYQCDLTTMVGRVQQDMREYVSHSVLPRFAASVLVPTGRGEVRILQTAEVRQPRILQLVQMLMALRQREFRPDSQPLRLLRQAIEPHPVSADNVR